MADDMVRDPLTHSASFSNIKKRLSYFLPFSATPRILAKWLTYLYFLAIEQPIEKTVITTLTHEK